MTATITSLAAREHINDLSREAEQSRHARELSRPRRRFSISGPFGRRVPRSAAV